MRWPFVARYRFEAAVELAAVLKDMTEVLKKQIIELTAQNDQLKALFDKTSAFEITEQTEETVTLRSKHPEITHGRAGWRARAAERSDRTVPAPADSVQALEQRVAEAGGKVG